MLLKSPFPFWDILAKRPLTYRLLTNGRAPFFFSLSLSLSRGRVSPRPPRLMFISLTPSLLQPSLHTPVFFYSSPPPMFLSLPLAH